MEEKWESAEAEGQFHFIINLQLSDQKMIPKTPIKKKSMEIEYNDFINNSCTASDKLVVAGNRSNFQSYLQKSIFKSRPEDPIFKNSQALINKKPTNGILGKKYAQPDNIFKSRQPQKQYRQVVISDEFVRSSKLYKMLKQQVSVTEAKHHKQATELSHTLREQEGSTKKSKDLNHEQKVSLWELKNQVMELKNILNEEEGENKRLVEEYENYEEEEPNEEGGEDQPNEEEGEDQQPQLSDD